MAISEGGSDASNAGFSSMTIGERFDISFGSNDPRRRDNIVDPDGSKGTEEIDFVDAAKQGGPKDGQVVVLNIFKKPWKKTAANYQRHESH